MDATLMAMFVDAVRARMVGSRVGVIRWLRPVLSLPLHGGRGTPHLVAILESPDRSAISPTRIHSAAWRRHRGMETSPARWSAMCRCLAGNAP